MELRGKLERPAPSGDGVRARVFSSVRGLLGEWVAGPGSSLETGLKGVEVRRGESLEFVTDCIGNDHSDSFKWELELISSFGTWSSRRDFSGPQPAAPAPPGPWARYAQMLLAANEFVFVD